MQATCNFGDAFKINPEYLTKFRNPAKVARFLRAVCMFWRCFGVNLASVCRNVQFAMEKCNRGSKINPGYLRNSKRKTTKFVCFADVQMKPSPKVFCLHVLHFPAEFTSFQRVSGSTCPNTCSSEVSWKNHLLYHATSTCNFGKFQDTWDSNLLLN